MKNDDAAQTPKPFDTAPQLAAILLKPFALDALLDTVKSALRVVVPLTLFVLCAPAAVQAGDLATPTDATTPPNAVTLSVRGKCEYSKDGTTFAPLAAAQILEQGATIRTADNARTDLFFRRTGITVRLQACSEMRLENMTITTKNGQPVVHTLLDLRAGRIFTVVRSSIAGSTLEIRNAAGRSVVEGSGVGRYIITADGTHVSAKDSAIPIKVISENGVTIIAAGQQFWRKDGKMLPLSTSPLVTDLIQLDELEASIESLPSEEPSPKP